MLKLFRRLHYLFSQRRVEAELAEEIEFHRAQKQTRLEEAGVPPAEAAYSTRRALGNVTLAREDARGVWVWAVLERTWQDIRYGARSLSHSPGFTLVAVITLTIGIGVNTAMFSVVNAVLLRPLPYADPDRLTMIWTADPARNIHEAATSFPTFTDWRKESRLFADMAFWRTHAGNLTGPGEPERVLGAMTSARLFSLLGVAPEIGRLYSADDEQRREPVVVLSHRLWQRRFGSDPGAIGQSIDIDGHRLEVIGVMPKGFYFPTKEFQHWVPASLHGPWAPKPEVAERSWGNRFADLWSVVGRLKPGATIKDAQAEMTALGRRLAETYPTSDPDVVGFGVEVVPVLQQITGRNLQLALWILLSAVGFILLIACANVANLVLARGAARTRELAVRAALGAGRGRLLRQLFIENMMLALGAGLLGALAAVVAVRVIAASAVAGIPRLEEIAVDPLVLAFTAVIATLAGLLFGTIPAWRLAQGNPGEALKDGGAGAGTGPRRLRVRGTLVIVECALAVALLAGAGLLIRSFLVVRGVNPGFADRDVLLVRVNLPIPVSRDWRQQEWRTFQQLHERIGALPGVLHVGAITNFLITRNPEEAITVEGRAASPERQTNLLVSTDDVTPGFFQAMGVPLLKGRFFTYQEQNAAVSIVNDAFARRFFPGEDPVGRRFKEGGPDARDAWITIVGVVGDMHRQGLEKQPVPEFFFPSSEPTMDIAIRMRADATTVTPAVRDAIRSVYRGAMVMKMATVEESLGELGAQRRFQTWLLSAFALLALTLSAIGVYGILHFAVAQRTHEFGVRIALGASDATLLRLVLADGMKLPCIGLGIGLASAFGLTRVLSHLLFDVSATDPITFVGVAALLLVVAFVACWLPARRAARVDPIVALRAD
jgi:putative ABC transport system permease protein